MSALDPKSLASAMQSAFSPAWSETTGNTLPTPTASEAEQQLALFLAIATGLLTYLHSNEATMITSITLTPTAGGIAAQAYNASQLVLNITGV